METSDYEVERFITHEKYSNFTKKYDIGLLKLNRDVVFYDKTYRDENPNESFGIPACLQQDAFTDVNVTAVSIHWKFCKGTHFIKYRLAGEKITRKAKD